MTHATWHQSRFLGIRGALIVVLSAAGVQPTEAQDSRTLPRVRSNSPPIADSIARGVERSPTLRHLVQSIDATDGLVYVDEGRCQNSVNACLLSSVLVAGPYRVLRIQVDPRKGHDCDLVASIGHELQHALEVLSNPGIRSHPQFFSFFDRVGARNENRFETKTALRMGLTIARECARDSARPPAQEREVFDSALRRVGPQSFAHLPFVLVSELPKTVSRGAEAWTVFDEQGKGDRIFVYTRSRTFRCASAPHSDQERCLWKLASVIVHEAWHFRNGRDEVGAYDAQLVFLQMKEATAFLQLNEGVAVDILEVRRARDRADADQRNGRRRSAFNSEGSGAPPTASFSREVNRSRSISLLARWALRKSLVVRATCRDACGSTEILSSR